MLVREPRSKKEFNVVALKEDEIHLPFFIYCHMRKRHSKSIKDRFTFKKRSTLNFNKRREKRDLSGFKYYALLISQILGSVFLAFLIAFTFFTGVTVSGISMEPTLNSGNRILVNRLGKLFSPKKDDVIAFEIQNGSNRAINIKRVVAISGDVVYISGGNLYVNGQKESDKNPDKEYIAIEEPGVAKNELDISDGEYFVLGDNRNNSEDSRYETIGMINKSDILGTVWLCYSLSNFGLVE